MTNQPKIGINCLIGNLEKYGYHHIHEIVMQSFYDFADKVFLLSSTRDVDAVMKSPKIELVSSAETWFDLDENGKEVYVQDKLVANSNLGLDVLAEDGFDIALNLSINQYIPETHFESLRRYIQAFYRGNKPLTWLYKMYQCGPQLYDADRRLPWVLNLHHRQRYRLAPDRIILSSKWLPWHPEKQIHIQSGWYKDFNRVSIIDITGEFTEKENDVLWTFMQNYGGYVKEMAFLVNGVYQHELWLNHLTKRFKAKYPSLEPLDTYGKAICQQSQPDFVSHELLRRVQQ